MLQQLVEVRGKIAAKSDELAKIFAEANSGEGKYDFNKVKCLGADMTSQKVAEKVGELNKELTDLGKEQDSYEKAMQADADAKRRNAGAKASDFRHADTSEKKEEKSLGQLFVESDAYAQRKNGYSAELPFEMKTLFQRNAGWEPESVRSGRVVPYATRPIQVMDLIPMIPTSQAAYKYMEESLFTNGAVEKGEGVAFGEAALALTERSVTIEKLPVWIPVTEEQLEDVQGINAYLGNRLPFMIRQRADSQIINGDGNTPNVLGVLAKPSIQTQARGSDPAPDAIRKAMTKVRVTGRANPNAVVLHPNDWQDIRLLRTTDGIYIWGNPSEEGVERIWGRPVAETDAIAENTGLVGDFANYSLFIERSGMDVQVGYVNDDFIKGKKAVRAQIRFALVWLRAAAFCTVTSL